MSVSGKVDPVVRPIAAADIAEALGQGLRDFQAMPWLGLAFGALYAAGGIAVVLSLTAFGLVYLAYPLAAGFALIGPFVVGMCMALVMPTSLALAGERIRGNPGALFGVLLTVAQVGGIVLPASIGLMAEQTSVRLGLSLLVVSFGAIAVIVRRVTRYG